MTVWNFSSAAVRALHHRADLARQRPETAQAAVKYDLAANRRKAILNAPQQPDLFADDVPADIRAYLMSGA